MRDDVVHPGLVGQTLGSLARRGRGVALRRRAQDHQKPGATQCQ